MIKWDDGRQGTGYFKKLVCQSDLLIPFDLYLLKYPQGSSLPKHNDPVKEGSHYRLNIVLQEAEEGGKFQAENAIFQSRFLNFFRPDKNAHSLTEVRKGTRYVLSLGFVLKTSLKSILS